MNQWQPIDTAPKDGSFFLATNGSAIDIAYWHAWARDERGDVIGYEGNDALVDAFVWKGEGWACNPMLTHWMPLPPPPKMEQA